MACLCGDLAFWEFLRVKCEHQMKGQANHWLQATPGFALLLSLTHWPGVPEPTR
jgi:hypothetical protein